MRFHTRKHFSLEARNLRRVLAKILRRLDDGKEAHRDYSCHTLSRAFVHLLHLYPHLMRGVESEPRVHDGLFAGKWAHSWISFPGDEFLLDVYPVAMLPGTVLLLEADCNSPWPSLYVPQLILLPNDIEERVGRATRYVVECAYAHGLHREDRRWR